METIGDAYCVAGGLNQVSDTHAQRVSKMALKMMEAARTVMSHDGTPLKVFITFFILTYLFYIPHDEVVFFTQELYLLQTFNWIRIK